MPTHVISANGLEPDPTTGDVQIPVLKRKIVLTDAQIKALPTTPVELVPAPGAGKRILPIACYIITNLTQVYTSSQDASLVLLLGGVYASGIAQTAFALAGTDDGIEIPIPYTSIGASSFAGIPVSKSASGASNTINQPLMIKDDYQGVADYTGGDPLNKFEVTIVFSIVDL